MLIVPLPSPDIFRGRSTAQPLLLRGPRLPDGRIADVVVADGVIVSVGEGPASCTPSHVMDLRGYLLLPSLVEPHAHLRLVAIRAPDLWDAVTSRAADRIVLRGGRVVARNIAADLDRQEQAVTMAAWN